MSILAAAAAGEPPNTLLQLAIALPLLAAGLLIARPLGALRPHSVSGPRRLESDTSVAGVFFVLVVGFVVWIGTQIAYLRMIRHRVPVGANETIDVAALPPLDMAILATLPFVVGLMVLMLGDWLAKPSLPRELAWTPRRLPGGVGQGLLAMLSVLPLMFGAAILLDVVYRTIGFQHPTEHEMLTVLGRSENRATTALIIGGATLLAPVFEEFLFRGHLQTILVSAFSPRRAQPSGSVLPDPPPPCVPAAPIDIGNGAIPDAATMPPAAFDPHVPSAPVRWTAIVITSLAFAVLHPGWTWPLIFLLSLALGYAYERTGNLWVPVVMHLVFNAVQTALFLITRGSL